MTGRGPIRRSRPHRPTTADTVLASVERGETAPRGVRHEPTTPDRESFALEINVPEPPGRPLRAPLPVLAAVAPVVVSLAAWAVTGSIFALIFAALGPVVAFAGVADGRLHGRQARRRSVREYARAVDAVACSIDNYHAAEVRRLDQHHPGSGVVATTSAPLPPTGETARLEVVIGRGAIESELILGGCRIGEDALRLRRAAHRLRSAPVVVDAARSIALIGGVVATRAIARGLVLQLAARSSPAQLGLELPDTAWEWAAPLPHRTDPRDRARPATAVLRVIEASATARPPGDDVMTGGSMILLCQHPDAVPADVGTVLRLDGATVLRAVKPGYPADCARGADGAVRPLDGAGLPLDDPVLAEPIPATVAGRAAALIGRNRAGRRHAGGVPSAVAFADLGAPSSASDAERDGLTLEARIGIGSYGPEAVDLVRDGPHAIVGGMTGSGKSELLVTWVLAMAATRSPDDVSFLLVDFKGGSAFDVLSTLPHCEGVITDLGRGEAHRALSSLSAELRRREELLAVHGARDIERLDPSVGLGRLVIVVDEFAAMLDGFPELHSLFTDLAARGRSLGIHLILGTQRPAGIVRDALLANAPLRLSLRVNNPGDSRAVVGTDEAHRLAADRPGRAVLSRDGATSILQIARTTDDDVRVIAERHRAVVIRKRPWLPPLPSTVRLDDVLRDLPAPGGAILLGILDRPEEQAQPKAWLEPADSPLLVVGGARSGLSTALRSIAVQAAGVAHVIDPGPDPERLWDAVDGAERLCAAQRAHRGRHGGDGVEERAILILDDLDAALGRLPADWLVPFLDRLQVVLRDSRRSGLTVVVSAQRVGGPAWSVLAGIENRLVLRMGTREAHLALGLPGSGFDPTAPPGRGLWRGEPIQLALPADRAESADGPDASSGASSSGTSMSRASGASGAPKSSAPPIRFAEVALWVVVARSPTSVAALIVRATHHSTDPLPEVVGLDGEPITPPPGESIEQSTSPGAAALLDRLAIRTSGAPPLIIVASADEWAAAWSLLPTLRNRATPMIFDGCSVSELRQISGLRELPPPCLRDRGRIWLVREGTLSRASWPEPPGVSSPVQENRSAIGRSGIP